MATVRVTRPRGGFRDALRAYRILIDEQESGTVRPGQSIDVAVAPGLHRVRAALSYVAAGDVGSEPFEVVVRQDETADLVVAPIGRPIYKPDAIGSRRQSYLEVRRR